MKKLILALTCLFLAIPCHADVIIVGPGGYSTIQAGVNAAGVGDTVIVAEGIYTGPENRDIDFGGKAITVRSENGPQNCIIDCNGTRTEPHRGFYFHSGEDSNSILNGFTITNGYAPEEQMGYAVQPCGGAICCNGSSPTITNCIIKDNASAMEGVGGGICCEDSNAMIQSCTIRNNWARQGGGIYAYCPVVVADCIITSNYVFGPGDRTVDGGGISCGEGATVVNCRITDNMARNGGGIRCRRPCIIRNSIFTGNRAEHHGGGIGVCSTWADSLIINCTFSGNRSSYGGGIDCYDCNARVINCILWDNTAAFGPEMSIYSRYRPSLLTTSYSNVVGGEGAVVRGEVTLMWGDGNIDIDPCFANSGSWVDANDPNIPVEPNDPNAIWIDGDYHLKSQAGRWDPNTQSWVLDNITSPCIDAGNPGCPLGDEPNDSNNVRINMGAYGGTAEASKSPANWRNIADLTNDWVVDSNDLKVFVGYWLETGQCIPSDLDRSQSVDFNDFAIFGQQWSEPSASEPGMTFQIDDCNMEEGQSQPVAAESNEPRFSLWVEGRYIHFEDQMYANCCPDELGLDKEINGNEITLYEIGYGGLCDCMCYFPITATLGPFEDGTYTVEVYDNYGNSLGVVEVTIGGSTGPGMTFQIDDCNMDEGQSWPVAAESNEPRFSVWVEGRYIYFEDQMYANCCPEELGLDKEINGNEITLYEIGYGGMCLCMCYFPVTATLGPFEDGTYTVEVYDNYGNSLGVVEVTIGGSPEPGITFRIDECDLFSQAEQSSQARFSVTVDGRYIHFEDLMYANCCPEELGLEMTVEDNLITIYETEYTPDGCRCMCNYPVSAMLGPFEPGIYTLEVYENYGGFIESTTVVIDPPE